MRILTALGLLVVFASLAGCSADPAPAPTAGGLTPAAADSADTSGAGAGGTGAEPAKSDATNAPAKFSLVGTYYPKSTSGSAAAAHWADFVAIDFKDDTRYALFRPMPCAANDGQADSCSTTGTFVATADSLTLKDDVTGTASTFQLHDIVLGASGSQGIHIQATGSLVGNGNLLPGLSSAGVTDADGATTQLAALPNLGQICLQKGHIYYGLLVNGSCDNPVTS